MQPCYSIPTCYSLARFADRRTGSQDVLRTETLTLFSTFCPTNNCKYENIQWIEEICHLVYILSEYIFQATVVIFCLSLTQHLFQIFLDLRYMNLKREFYCSASVTGSQGTKKYELSYKMLAEWTKCHLLYIALPGSHSTAHHFSFAASNWKWANFFCWAKSVHLQHICEVMLCATKKIPPKIL